MNVLVTLGANIEKIDAVRFITNFSTGKTGSEIANEFGKKHSVLCLCGKYSQKPKKAKKIIIFENFADLDGKIKKLLKKYSFDLIIHCAAVSDYSPKIIKLNKKNYVSGKIKKINSNKTLTVIFEKNFKILDKLTNYAKNNPLIVGFKLGNSNNKSDIIQIIEKLNCGIIVYNNINEISRGKNIFRIYKDGKLLKKCKSRKELASKLRYTTEEIMLQG